jgi:hypothetical protein
LLFGLFNFLQYVQVITVAIDQYAEKALGSRDYFLKKSPTASAKRNAVPARINERNPFPLDEQPL